ncbi:hypothetical protein LWI29_021526 [Acer saccharum]|uniref:50S ribosomal protein L33, chloroplastic n=1 Tax=Acer saccharum TaxID=4024 RepID=A0AA39W4F5_ACESA|nr:hypothetical protein LWI29_021526 [Acer saccharum]
MALANPGFSLSCKPRNPFLSTHSCTTQPNVLAFRSLSFSTALSHHAFSKGCLSLSHVLQRPSFQSIICMARRYASNSRLRKMQSRKRGGDRDKKKKRKRKRAGKRKGRGETKKNKNLKVVRLVSSAGTGFSYAKKKNTKKKEKLEIKKYDPQMKRHVKFMEVK